MPSAIDIGGEEWLSGPYPERLERDASRLDGWLFAGLERLGRAAGGRLARLERQAEDILALAPALRRLGDDEVLARANRLRPAFLRQGLLQALVFEAFALTREATRRCLGIEHHPVQLMGGLALVDGMLAEMATGEGKTITAALAAATMGLAGLPVHVITVNDYLARRDGEELASIYAMLGLSTAIVEHGQSAVERAAIYQRDIVYAANKEVAFDYLRDRISLGARRNRADVALDRLDRAGGEPALLLRGLGFALVDEADSVLVDEARTPLIISAPVPGRDLRADFEQALALAGQLAAGGDFERIDSRRHIGLTARGRAAIDQASAGRGGLWRVRRARYELVTQALSALHLFARDEHYIVADGKVQIVDEFTGRVAEGRAWERGLHQMIEVKEGLEPSERRDAQARITYQRFFRRYLRLAGMSGTAAELAGEVRAVYGLRVVTIPQNRPPLRSDDGVALFRDSPAKWRAVAGRAAELQRQGRPVLIGTRSVAASEGVSAELARLDIPHAVLNARQDREEAEIVARAGQGGRITVATNMAGRGTDIRLGAGIAEIGGLAVLLTEFHETPRIDRQLIGRGGRQGDPTSMQAFIALDDEVFARHARFERRLARLWPAAPDGRIALPGRLVRALKRAAQKRAERQNAAIRRETQRSDRQFRKALAFAGLQD